MSLIILAVALEAIVGVALIVSPSPAAVLVFGGALSAPGEAIGRLAGVALLALAVACSPSAAKGPSSDLRGLLAYNLLATIFFLSVGIDGRSVGVLLWPVVGLHAILTALILRAWVVAKQK